MNAAAATLGATRPGVLDYNDVTHTYMLDGQRCRSVTNVAKIPTDDYTVNQWRHRMAALGFVLDPSLLEDIAAHRDDNNRVNDIVQKAIEVAGANKGAQRGTQAHAATEYHDLDQPLLTAQQRRDADVWQRTLTAYGIEIEGRWIEQVVCYPDDLIAGRIDRYAWMGGHLFDIDTKTGSSAWRYPHGTAVQLALHVSAPWIQNGSTIVNGIETIDNWVPQPSALRRDIAYILSMPTRDDADIGVLYRFQLEGKFAGHAGRVAAITARHFQLNSNLCQRVDPPLRPAPRSYDADQASLSEAVALVNDSMKVVAAFDTTAPLAQQIIVDRIMELSDHDKARLRGMWAAEQLPSIGTPMAPGELRRAWELVDQVDPWLTVAEPPAVERHVASEPLPPAEPPMEGQAPNEEQLLGLSQIYVAMPDEARQRVNEIQAEATREGVPFHLSALSSERRYQITLALINLAVNGSCDDCVVRACVTDITRGAIDGNDLRYSVGRLVGCLGVDEACAFVDITEQLLTGRVALRFLDADRAVLDAPDITALTPT